jgi:hypothetical protein
MAENSLVKRINAAFQWGEQRNILAELAGRIAALEARDAAPDLSITYHNTPEKESPWPFPEGPGVTIDPAEDAT